MAVLLGGAALCGCANPRHDAAAAGNQATQQQPRLAGDLEGGVREARGFRLAGRYDDAIHVLSQLMLVAADDPRVVGEYGKTLAEQGRAQEASQFLSRAIELSPGDWTLYSALGVSYDEQGKQDAARAAYERALALQPNEPSVLNNYALSRMMANDPAGARALIARAQGAGGEADPKIARNIAMVNQLASAAPQTAMTPAAPVTPQLPQPSPGVVMQPLPAAPQAKPATRPPHPLAPTVADLRGVKSSTVRPMPAKPGAPKAEAKAQARPAPRKQAPAAKPAPVPALRLAADKY